MATTTIVDLGGPPRRPPPVSRSRRPSPADPGRRDRPADRGVGRDGRRYGRDARRHARRHLHHQRSQRRQRPTSSAAPPWTGGTHERGETTHHRLGDRGSYLQREGTFPVTTTIVSTGGRRGDRRRYSVDPRRPARHRAPAARGDRRHAVAGRGRGHLRRRRHSGAGLLVQRRLARRWRDHSDRRCPASTRSTRPARAASRPVRCDVEPGDARVRWSSRSPRNIPSTMSHGDALTRRGTNFVPSSYTASISLATAPRSSGSSMPERPGMGSHTFEEWDLHRPHHDDMRTIPTLLTGAR